MNPPSVPDLRGLRFRITTMLEGLEHFPEKWTLISGLPEISTQCQPSRLQPTWVVFRRKCDQLKKLERVSDSSKSKCALEIAGASQER
jgi:hypothetical protein